LYRLCCDGGWQKQSPVPYGADFSAASTEIPYPNRFSLSKYETNSGSCDSSLFVLAVIRVRLNILAVPAKYDLECHSIPPEFLCGWIVTKHRRCRQVLTPPWSGFATA
jgi:hypothetical protein